MILLQNIESTNGNPGFWKNEEEWQEKGSLDVGYYGGYVVFYWKSK